MDSRLPGNKNMTIYNPIGLSSPRKRGSRKYTPLPRNLETRLRRCICCTYALLIVLWLVPGAAYPEIKHSRQPDTAKECAVCHYEWVPTFFIEHRGTPLAPLQEQNAVGDRAMCLSCHDGSIREARDKICNDPGHRIGVVPSKRVRIPGNFPLDANGAMLCTTCHTPHALSQEYESTISFFLRAPNSNSSFCRLCHVDRAGGPAQGNHPIDVSAKDIPPVITRAGGLFGSDRPHQIICETCHIAHGGVNASFLVMPDQDPQAGTVLCEACHTRSPGQISGQPRSWYSHPVDVPPGTAAALPPAWSSGERLVLGTRGELICRTCHRPHQAPGRDFLLAEGRGKDGLCRQCHQQQAAIAGTDHDLSRQTGAAQKGLCGPCHAVHAAAQQEYLWSAPQGPLMLADDQHADASGKAGMLSLCTGCHGPGGSAANKVPRLGLHPQNLLVPGLDSGAAPADAGKSYPLYDGFHADSGSGIVVCSTCHDAHVWSPRARAELSEQKADGDATASFLRPGAHQHLCAVCHGKDALFKFLYFHARAGREQRKALFTFEEQ